jgi:hypothetical protein
MFDGKHRKGAARLVVHAGLHKTATTSFQALCGEHHQVLLENGVFYPRYGLWPQHSYAAWLLQQRDLDGLRSFLQFAFDGRGDADTVLLSGEDFENCLVDLHGARILQDEARRVGFREISWIFVHRHPLDYLFSIYAEMSKHGVTLNLSDLATIALKNGYFSTATRNYNYVFVFDVLKRIATFRNEVSQPAALMGFSEFAGTVPGLALLGSMVADRQALRELSLKPSGGTMNARMSAMDVERGYARNAIGCDGNSADSVLVDEIAALRLAINAGAEADIRSEFERTFGLTTP